jgi:hypothetical protein
MKEEGECGRMRGKKRQMGNKEWHRHTVTNVEYKALLLPPPPRRRCSSSSSSSSSYTNPHSRNGGLFSPQMAV